MLFLDFQIDLVNLASFPTGHINELQMGLYLIPLDHDLFYTQANVLSVSLGIVTSFLKAPLRLETDFLFGWTSEERRF